MLRIVTFSPTYYMKTQWLCKCEIALRITIHFTWLLGYDVNLFTLHMTEDKKVAFIHPDLGIGGAERLTLDSVRAVESVYPSTTIWTSFFDENHCFEDAKTHKIEVRGNKIPRGILGFGHIFFALLSNLYLTICCAIKGADIFIVDQISAWLFVLRLLRPKSRIIFYCHFPDLLLAKHDSFLRRIYRFFFDGLERFGLRFANEVFVNSEFTAAVVSEHLGMKNVRVLYPCVDCSRQFPRVREGTTFVSLNRYERKKDHGLAIKALNEVKDQIPEAKMVIVGGYDERVRENVEHYQELSELVKSLGLEDKVSLLKNIEENHKWELISHSTAIVYTPQREHFGIVPIEAMSLGVPVIACNSGGPRETCSVEGSFLCEPTPEDFGRAMVSAAHDIDRTDSLKAHAKTFGYEAFSDSWRSILTGSN